MEANEIFQIANHFDLKSVITAVSPFGGGHINDTFRVETENQKNYILQKINKNVFKQPLHVIQNIERLLMHFAEKGDKSLQTFATKSGEKFYVDSNQDFWRMYNFVEGANSYEVIQNKSQAYQAAKAFGSFQLKALDLNSSDFNETIPNFHHLGKRYEKFDLVLQANPKNRAEFLETEISFVQKQRKIAVDVLDLIASGQLPIRVTHNDTKLNNALLNNESGKAVCVIDLDKEHSLACADPRGCKGCTMSKSKK